MKPEIDYVYNKLKRLRFDLNSSDFKDFRSYYRYDPELMRYVRKDDNDLFIAKEAFNPLEEELEYADKCHSLEEQLGCPLEVILKLVDQNELYYQFFDELQHWTSVKVDLRKKVVWYCKQVGGHYACSQPLSNYGKTFWLKEDKSE